jgi:hypothetical protein
MISSLLLRPFIQSPFHNLLFAQILLSFLFSVILFKTRKTFDITKQLLLAFILNYVIYKNKYTSFSSLIWKNSVSGHLEIFRSLIFLINLPANRQKKEIN